VTAVCCAAECGDRCSCDGPRSSLAACCPRIIVASHKRCDTFHAPCVLTAIGGDGGSQHQQVSV